MSTTGPPIEILTLDWRVSKYRISFAGPGQSEDASLPVASRAHFLLKGNRYVGEAMVSSSVNLMP